MTADPARAPLSEADLCAAFIVEATKDGRWTAYPETAGFDILLVRKADGHQIGIEAKLALNARVVAQALPGRYGYEVGPDHRAVLVPATKRNQDLEAVCAALGITVIVQKVYPGSTYYGSSTRGPAFDPSLPREGHEWTTRHWQEWAPLQRCPLPDYVPDVVAGASGPVALTAWKVKAIKLLVLLGERPVTRADFKHLGLSPTNWTGRDGWLVKTETGWIAGPRTPDLRRQHPRNFAEIEADKARWAPPIADQHPIRPKIQEALL